MESLELSDLEKFTGRIYNMFPKDKQNHDLYLKIYDVIYDVSEKSYKECGKEISDIIRGTLVKIG
ncbi:MAG: hypothetical protein WC346_22140 [Methanogenium sp.]|jgi:metal-dependent HD superfamily phosphatase/phosphodiesterase